MERESNLAGLINSITDNITSIVRGHIELAKAEALEAVKNAIKSSVLFIIALAMVNLGMIFLFIAGAFWISDQFEVSSAAGFLITGAILFLCSALMVTIAVWKIKAIKNSRKTIDSINQTSESLMALRPFKNN